MQYPPLSLIVPARNEALAIEKSLRGLTALAYPSLEIVVVDDSSSDNTYALAAEFVKNYQGPISIQLLRAPGEPPPGWVGKTFAADYAIKNSRGEIILVCDVDTEHEPESLTNSIQAFEHARASLMARIPRMQVYTLGELPLPFWTFILWASSFCAKLLGSKQSFAMGTYLLFTRSFYERSGGWQVHRSFPESLPLLNYCITHHERFVLMQSYGEISARMYEGAKATARGITRNINFTLLQPLPFIFSLILFTALAEIVDTIVLERAMWAWISFGVYAAVYCIFLYANRYPWSTILGAAITLPIMPFYFLCIALYALMRNITKTPTMWRGRPMRVQ